MNDVCTTRQAAEQLGVSLRTVQLWVESGVLKAWKTAGGHRRVARESVEALLNEKREALGEASANHTLKILIVEQDPDMIRLFELTLASWNLPIEVISASNGIDGLTLLGSARPDVLFTDLVLSGLDGLEMVRVLRDNPEHDAMSIVIVSSLDAREITRDGGLPEDIQLLSRPIRFDAVESLVRRKLAERGVPAHATGSERARRKGDVRVEG